MSQLRPDYILSASTVCSPYSCALFCKCARGPQLAGTAHLTCSTLQRLLNLRLILKNPLLRQLYFGCALKSMTLHNSAITVILELEFYPK